MVNIVNGTNEGIVFFSEKKSEMWLPSIISNALNRSNNKRLLMYATISELRCLPSNTIHVHKNTSFLKIYDKFATACCRSEQINALNRSNYHPTCAHLLLYFPYDINTLINKMSCNGVMDEIQLKLAFKYWQIKRL